jgi:sugar (pentulose or hexulose) kinase
MDAVFAVDIGTSSVRAGLFDVCGRDISPPVREVYDLAVGSDGRADANPLRLVELVARTIDAALQMAPRDYAIAAVGFSTFWHSLLGLDEQGDLGRYAFGSLCTRAAIAKGFRSATPGHRVSASRQFLAGEASLAAGNLSPVGREDLQVGLRSRFHFP